MPLQTLDHVMLWIARVFIAIAFSATFYDCFIKNPWTPDLGHYLPLAMAFAWFVCILQIKRLVCRCILGITSLFFLLWIPLTRPFSEFTSIHFCIPMIGSGTILWSALRGATEQKPSALNPA